MNHLDKLNALPPCWCRYVARTANGRRGLTTVELANASGLAETTVKELTYRVEWDSVTNFVTEKFASACGVNLLAARKHRDFFKRRKMIHVENATGSAKRMYDRIERLIVEEAEKRKRTKQTV